MALTPAARTRDMIINIMLEVQLPLSSRQIADIIQLKFGRNVSVASVGANLAYLRVGQFVDRKPCPVWGNPYYRGGVWHFQTENYWWHTLAVRKDAALAFIRKRRLMVEHDARENQRRKGRPVTYKLQPRTDDMRQMLVDLRAAQ